MGSVVISVDAELGWGFHDLAKPPERRVESGRPGWRALLDLFDEFDVPATWAYVGHLLLEDCDGQHGDYPSGWFTRERGEWSDRPDLRFGRELVKAVRAADADHELGCHTFSHVEFGDASTELARAEVEASVALANAEDIDLASFVFPRNNVGHLDVLAEWGFTCYRGETPVARTDSRLRRLLQATVGDWTPPLVEPRLDSYGMVNVPASLYLFSFEGRARSLVEPVFGDPVVRQACRGIDAAADGDGVLHLWLHPNNLVDDRDRDRMRAILEHVERRGVRVETMRGVAERVLDGLAASAVPVDRRDG
ncbi:polysaccharide deacetylase family protein [Halorarius halobius]|uniref:polysaccharide deacetylase family protein n=1 Tax=Halorarius halobius TaxID=2962671 RepID=UPI0020CB7D9B|nr:polysaccharide deacetylase family protein [Halorarius halobius]